ncbi:MAG TPA: porin [Thermoanaerobaculia bacterium]|nr:porin [Thermoanaerobaculia bacterium]
MAAALFLVPGVARGQAPPAGTAEPTLDDTIEAGESEAEEPRRQLVRWNQYEGPFFTIRVGAGALYEGAAYGQDEESKQQFALAADSKFRDTRLLLKGRFPKFDREVTWTSGIMYDGPTGEWFMRETGVMIAVPEIWGHVFIGRTKEGFSLNKVMNGYSGWTMERTMMNDVIPILADGVKWLGYLPEHHFLWNLGFFNDWLSEGQGFSTYDKQAVARLAWLPLASESSGELVHLGVSLRYGEPEGGKLRLRSRPETYPAPYFVDTGSFPADHTKTIGVEGYYRSGPWLFGTEYIFHDTSPKQGRDSLFHGGEVVVSWNITGETRGYNTRGGFFKAVSPEQTVFEGGPGAWEAVLRLSYIDLDDEGIQGGKFWRITPMMNWHLSDNARLEFAYGYGTLDRFDLEGGTHFFQSRIQLQF